MRFPIRSLLILTSVLAVGISLAKAAYLRWPDGSISFTAGIALLAVIASLLWVFMLPELRRVLARGLIMIAASFILTIAYWRCPSTGWLVVGLAVGWIGYLAAARYLADVLAWCGLEDV